MKPTDYDMIKLALNSVDLVILRSLVQQAMKRRPPADWQRLDLLTRARVVSACDATRLGPGLDLRNKEQIWGGKLWTHGFAKTSRQNVFA